MCRTMAWRSVIKSVRDGLFDIVWWSHGCSPAPRECAPRQVGEECALRSIRRAFPLRRRVGWSNLTDFLKFVGILLATKGLISLAGFCVNFH